MLTIVELKKKLISKITDTEDINLLSSLLLIFDVEESVYKMSDEEKAAVQEGIDDIEAGRFITHEEANRRIDELLKKDWSEL